MTKDGFARTVPIHEHLVEEGLVSYWQAARPGHLFMGDKPPKEDATRSPQEMRASELAEWIRKRVGLDEGVSPNRVAHTFSSNAEAAGISKRTSNVITGHNRVRDASDGYVTLSVSQLTQAMSRYPRYQV